MKRIVRRALWVLAALLAIAATGAVGIIGRTEWNYRAAMRQPQGPVPPGLADAADAHKPTLILLHGAGLNGHMWDAVRRHIDPAYRVLALDLPAHGAQRGVAYSLEGAAATVAAAAKAVAPTPVLLVGDSLGGYSAIAAAASLPPQQLRGLVLAGSSSNFGDATRWPRYAVDLVKITLVAAVVDNADFAGRALALFGVAEADRSAIIAAGVNLPAVAAAGRALIGVDMLAKVAAIDAPVLVVNGAQDTRAVAQEASFVAAAKRATQVRFEDTGHGVSMRRPADFARVVNAFAARAFAAAPQARP